MLEKLETFTKVGTSSMEVRMSYQSTSAIHGYGTVFELAVVHMEGFVILTPILVLLL